MHNEQQHVLPGQSLFIIQDDTIKTKQKSFGHNAVQCLQAVSLFFIISTTINTFDFLASVLEKLKLVSAWSDSVCVKMFCLLGLKIIVPVRDVCKFWSVLDHLETTMVSSEDLKVLVSLRTKPPGQGCSEEALDLGAPHILGHPPDFHVTAARPVVGLQLCQLTPVGAGANCHLYVAPCQNLSCL